VTFGEVNTPRGISHRTWQAQPRAKAALTQGEAGHNILRMKVLPFATLTAGLLFAVACGSSRIASGNQRAAGALFDGWPPVIVWAWQRPEDLSFINPRQVGVSRLVETILLKGEAVIVVPNLNGLRVPVGAKLMACARIESSPGFSATLSPSQAREAAKQLASLARSPGAKAVQIDFDATDSQRDFYRTLLIELRQRLPRSFPISITALGSWCVGDDWISHLPVDEAVPMLFRMGPDRASILRRLEDGDDFQEPLCRQSAGISTDEVVPRLPAGRRLYIFNPRAWTKATLDTAAVANR
jgi:hypothetical protein